MSYCIFHLAPKIDRVDPTELYYFQKHQDCHKSPIFIKKNIVSSHIGIGGGMRPSQCIQFSSTKKKLRDNHTIRILLQ
jgi:hypothetical protein